MKNILFKNSYEPENKVIDILCLKQSDKKDGIFFYAIDMVDELAQKNSVRVYCNDLFKTELQARAHENFEVILLPTIHSKPLKWLYLLFLLPFMMLFKSKKVDDIIFTTEDLPVISLKMVFALFKPKTAIILVIHDLAEYFIDRYSKYKDIYRRFIVKKLAFFADKILADCQNTKNDIVNLQMKDPNDVDLFYNKINCDKLTSPKRTSSDPKYHHAYTLYVAGLDFPSKNHLWLLDEYKRLKTLGLKEKLYLVGSVDENSKNLDAIKSKIIQLELENDVEIFPNVTQDDLLLFYTYCQYTLCASNYEGFGRPIVESLCFDKEIYSTDVGIYKELKEHPMVHSFKELQERVNQHNG